MYSARLSAARFCETLCRPSCRRAQSNLFSYLLIAFYYKADNSSLSRTRASRKYHQAVFKGTYNRFSLSLCKFFPKPVLSLSDHRLCASSCEVSACSLAQEVHRHLCYCIFRLVEIIQIHPPCSVLVFKHGLTAYAELINSLLEFISITSEKPHRAFLKVFDIHEYISLITEFLKYIFYSLAYPLYRVSCKSCLSCDLVRLYEPDALYLCTYFIRV